MAKAARFSPDNRKVRPGWVTGLVLGSVCWALLPATVADDTPQEPGEAWPDSSVTFSAALFSNYVWRGLLVTDGPVLQPAIDAAHRGFSINVWANMDLDDVNGNRREFNEIDLSLAYGHSFEGKVDLSGGFINYTFPSTLLEDTTEMFVMAEFDVVLQPTLVASLDLDSAAGGSYWNAGCTHSFALLDAASNLSWSVDLAANLGWGSSEYNELYFQVSGAGFTDFTAVVATTAVLPGGWSIVASVGYSAVLSRSLRDAVLEPDNFFGGVAASYGF